MLRAASLGSRRLLRQQTRTNNSRLLFQPSNLPARPPLLPRALFCTNNSSSDRDPTLLEGWVEVQDPKSGKPYYYHSKTRRTTWEKPLSNDQKYGAQELEGEGEGQILYSVNNRVFFAALTTGSICHAGFWLWFVGTTCVEQEFDAVPFITWFATGSASGFVFFAQYYAKQTVKQIEHFTKTDRVRFTMHSMFGGEGRQSRRLPSSLASLA